MATCGDGGALATKPGVTTNIFKVGDRVAVIHLHGLGKHRRREVVRIDTVEIVTSKDVVTDHAQFNAETGFQVGGSEYQIVPVTPEHEAELKRAAKRGTGGTKSFR
jgi:hypothetical protein